MVLPRGKVRGGGYESLKPEREMGIGEVKV